MRRSGAGAPVLRRWYVVLLGLLATLGALYAASLRVTPYYEALATVVLVPGPISVTEGDNPFLYMGGLGQARATLVELVMSPETVDSVIRTEPEIGYAVLAENDSAAPMINVWVFAPEGERAVSLRTEVLGVLDERLEYMQDQVSAPEDSRIWAMPVTSLAPPEAQTQRVFRIMLVIAAGGVGASVLSAGLLDVILRSRGRGSRQRAHRVIEDAVDEIDPDAARQQASTAEFGATETRSTDSTADSVRMHLTGGADR